MISRAGYVALTALKMGERGDAKIVPSWESKPGSPQLGRGRPIPDILGHFSTLFFKDVIQDVLRLPKGSMGTSLLQQRPTKAGLIHPKEEFMLASFITVVF